jgi:hypothetical protein
MKELVPEGYEKIFEYPDEQSVTTCYFSHLEQRLIFINTSWDGTKNTLGPISDRSLKSFWYCMRDVIEAKGVYRTIEDETQ